MAIAFLQKWKLEDHEFPVDWKKSANRFGVFRTLFQQWYPCSLRTMSVHIPPFEGSWENHGLKKCLDKEDVPRRMHLYLDLVPTWSSGAEFCPSTVLSSFLFRIATGSIMFRVPAEFSMFQGSLGPKVRMYVPGIAWQMCFFAARNSVFVTNYLPDFGWCIVANMEHPKRLMLLSNK